VLIVVVIVVDDDDDAAATFILHKELSLVCCNYTGGDCLPGGVGGSVLSSGGNSTNSTPTIFG
jgi:hypothetical protein